VLAAVYTYGHLVVGPVSVVMAIAFTVIGLQVPGWRRDLTLAAIFLVAASTSFFVYGMLRQQTVGWGRAYVASVYALHAVAVVGVHALYGGTVLASAQRRRVRALTAIYALVCAAGAVTLLAGLHDRGVRAIDVLGIHATMLHAGVAHASFNVVVLIGGEAFTVWVLTRPGPLRRERLLFAIPVGLGPLAVLHEQLVTLGWIDSVPLGGYFTALTGLIGAWILADRVRSLTGEPRRLAGYELVRKLGTGGLAVVWLASRDGVAIALKRLRPELAEDPRLVRMFLAEARLAARLRHPHIVSLLEAGSTEHGVYLAMELVDGPSLARIVQHLGDAGERPPIAAVVEIGAQLADALAYAHALRDGDRPLEVVHRDVSPQNVLVARTGEVKLTDFGIARSIEQTSHTQTGVLKGKVRYMAPEQLRGAAYDQRVDIYALGVVLLELAVARPRFAGLGDMQILYRILEGDEDEDALAAIPAELAAVLREATDPDPTRRTRTAVALLDALAPLRQPADGIAALARLASVVPAAPVIDASSLPFDETRVA